MYGQTLDSAVFGPRNTIVIVGDEVTYLSRGGVERTARIAAIHHGGWDVRTGADLTDITLDNGERTAAHHLVSSK